MSKIQKALGKIQGKSGAATADTESLPTLTDTVTLATLVDKGRSHIDPEVSVPRLHIDHDALRNAGLIAPDQDERLIANQYRDIKRPLIAHAFGKKAVQVEAGNLIMVSSSLSGEGKTFTSINLALSMAKEKDHVVLLVDADVAKPHTSEMFGVQDQMGLLDLLEDPSIPVNSLIIPTDIENLSVLPAGKPRLNATELLASKAMEEICSFLGNLSDGQIVIFDSPPILQTSEAKVLAAIVGQIVLVVRAESTPQDAVVGALASLDQDKAINLILNQVRVGHGDKHYGYGYGYTSVSQKREAEPSGSADLWG